MIGVFSVTTSAGIIIGIGVSASYDPESVTGAPSPHIRDTARFKYGAPRHTCAELLTVVAAADLSM
jgi:hypothetical protein